MTVRRKPRTVGFDRRTALTRAVVSTEAEGGTVSRVQRRIIRAYVSNELPAAELKEQTRVRIQKRA